ncbi:ATP-binding protein [Salinisphaera aquimarina]|uniref:histidine kinase n=1 Tax=Salinisphaera aquimarina TaxID=2094031 RepID=A0ABV7ETS9_9GAMM
MQAVVQLTPQKLLTWLYRLRWGAVMFVLLAIVSDSFVPGVALAVGPLLAIATLLAIINVAIGLSLRRARAATELELLGHLALDTLALSAILFWAGGSASPFVSLYLLPIAIAAAALPRMYAWAIAVLATGAYSALLLRFFYPVHTEHGSFAMHVLGMWATFLISAIVLVVFVSGMAAAVRRRDLSLARAREQMLRNEQVTALGALAAGAAHELGTPLSTMAIIISELRDQYGHDQELTGELVVLAEQIDLCTDQITQLLGTAGDPRAQDARPIAVADWLGSVIARWRLMRPEIQARSRFDAALDGRQIHPDAAIAQSLINLLNNAADASVANARTGISVAVTCRQERLLIVIEDEGNGIDRQDMARAGRLRFSTKPEGRGLGLVLSHVSLERVGGEVSLAPRIEGGTRTRISLPLDRLEVPA